MLSAEGAPALGLQEGLCPRRPLPRPDAHALAPAEQGSLAAEEEELRPRPPGAPRSQGPPAEPWCLGRGAAVGAPAAWPPHWLAGPRGEGATTSTELCWL